MTGFLLTWLPVGVGMVWGVLAHRVYQDLWHRRRHRKHIAMKLEREGWELIEYRYLGHGEVMFEARQKQGAHDADHNH